MSSHGRGLKLGLSLALVHLLILASGVTGARKHCPPWLKKGLWIYERVTGAGGGFGFFSPSIGQQLLVRFKIENGEGHTEELGLEKILPHEAVLRYGNMVRFFASSYDKEDLRRSLAASLTANVFNRFDDARKITFEASVFHFPSLSDYRAGERPRENQAYQITFWKKPK